MSKLLSPSAEGGEAWDRITIGGVVFTGKIDVKGTPWKKKHDRRHARGRNGARSVATGWDLGEWTLTLAAFDDETDAQLGELVDAVTGASPATQDATALSVEHPAFAAKGVNQVTFEEGDCPTPSGPGGLLVWEIKLKEYRPPEPRPVTRTPAPAPQAPEAPEGKRNRFGVASDESYAPDLPSGPSADP